MSGGLPVHEDANELERELEECTHLQVLVPSVTASSRDLPLDRWTKRVLALVVPLGGGAMEFSSVKGHWINGRGELITEEVRVIDVHLTRRLTKAEGAWLASKFYRLAVDMEQEALALVVGGRLHLLRPRLALVANGAPALVVNNHVEGIS